jgi:protein phosphatase
MATAFIKAALRDQLGQLGQTAPADDVEAALLASIDAANGAIFNMSRTNPQYAGMGTTLVAGVFHGAELILAHVGDSRCYRLRGNALEQITRDHSMHQEQIDIGLITAEQAALLPGNNVVTRALGIGETVEIEVHRHALMSGDRYLMCSDGLSDMLADEAIAAILVGESLPDTARHLIDAANASGGRDNISVLLVSTDDRPAGKGRLSLVRRALHGAWLPGRSSSY